MNKLDENELRLDPKNYRIHGEKNRRLIKKSLEDCGAGRSILIDDENCIIAGNGVYEQAKELGLPVRVIESDGTELIAIKRTDLTTEDSRRKALALADNHTTDTSVFDFDMIAEDFSPEELCAWDFDFDTIGSNFFDDTLSPTPRSQPAVKVGNLKERFIIPPFSILDTKLGAWQERKRAWLSLGIKSEVGRDMELTYNRSSQPPRIYAVRNQLREQTGSDPSWDEIFEYCQSHGIPLMDGTSIFDPVLCELVYRWFNVPGGSILDPFAGGSVRGIVAAKLGMAYHGIDLRQEQIDANYQNASTVLNAKEITPNWVCNDSRNVDTLFPGKKFNLLFSCPPYADLEVYSDDPRDLSTMKYPEFVAIYRDIIRKCCDRLEENSFAVFVVAEVRDKKGGYYGFVQDTIQAFIDSGLTYYNEIVLANQICSLAMRVTKQFNNSRKIGKCHQNVLVFYKGNPEKTKEHFPELDYSDDELFTGEEIEK